MDIDDEVATRRIMGDDRATDSFKSFEEALAATKHRNEHDRNRYLKLYNIDLWDPKHYDLIIDTSEKSPHEVLEIILSKLPNQL